MKGRSGWHQFLGVFLSVIIHPEHITRMHISRHKHAERRKFTQNIEEAFPLVFDQGGISHPKAPKHQALRAGHLLRAGQGHRWLRLDQPAREDTINVTLLTCTHTHHIHTLCMPRVDVSPDDMVSFGRHAACSHHHATSTFMHVCYGCVHSTYTANNT